MFYYDSVNDYCQERLLCEVNRNYMAKLPIHTYSPKLVCHLNIICFQAANSSTSFCFSKLWNWTSENEYMVSEQHPFSQQPLSKECQNNDKRISIQLSVSRWVSQPKRTKQDSVQFCVAEQLQRRLSSCNYKRMLLLSRLYVSTLKNKCFLIFLCSDLEKRFWK